MYVLVGIVFVVAVFCVFQNTGSALKAEQPDAVRTLQSLTREALEAVPDEELELAIIDFISDYKIKKNYSNAYKIVTGLPKGLQYMYATWWLEAEVYNGGFNQYFFNSAGQFVREALEGCRVFGAVQHAALLEEAIAIYQEEEELHSKVKEEGTLEAFSQSYEETRLNEVDTRFYSMDENMSQLRVQYIRSHVEQFICP